MKSDKTIRSLEALAEGGSSYRVLNLVRVHKIFKNNEDFKKSPLFKNPALDRSIILKHRLRPHEIDLFSRPRVTATKILVPLDHGDLRSGAWSIFIGEKLFEEAVEQILEIDLKSGGDDRDALDIIDSLPSLDPFLLREKLRENGIVPARQYFSISEKDLSGMFEYTRKELSVLAVLSAGPDANRSEYGRRLAEKILNPGSDGEFELLKSALQMSDREYTEGMFAWKGFIYYSWIIQETKAQMMQVLGEIQSIEPTVVSSADVKEYTNKARSKIFALLVTSMERAENIVGRYKTAYSALTVSKEPATFRAFLMSAPDMFVELGEYLGSLQHITSFWKYRFPAGRPRLILASDLAEMFVEFEDSLAGILHEDIAA
ncbi:MAG: hypothetical protein MH112_12505 [Phenylobacterium sp.]|uniref:hypothetical protein n=1 Tax=Phenylobacterium sp. TaxID=1871053 RepID=UPI0025D2F64B|nr:hypothetical protein [Phenylobacterium sp.]MCG9917163.1 hypothetical protein [Phenylobacterium sp.]